MRGLGPEDEALAHGVGRRDGQPFGDQVVIAADVVLPLVGMENAERIGEAAHHAPVREVGVALVRRQVGGVVQDDRPRGIELRKEPADLLPLPSGQVEVPRGDQHGRRGIVFAEFRKDAAVGVELHLQIVRTVLEHLALGNADRMEHLRRAVCVDMRLREFPVVVQIAVVADIPHGIAGIAHVGAARLGAERGVLRLEERLRRATVPMGHRTHVLGMDQLALGGIAQYVAAQLAAVFERPGRRAVVERPWLGLGKRSVRGRIGHDIGECLLENVVHADTEHEEVQPLLEHPVDLALPLPGPPVLGLKAAEAAVGEVAESAVVEMRRFAHVEPRHRNRLPRGNHVPVPKIAASGLPLEEVIDGVERRPAVAAG